MSFAALFVAALLAGTAAPIALVVGPAPAPTETPVQEAAAPAGPSSLAQQVPAYAGAVEAILREALERGRAYERLVALCERAPRRLSGSPGYDEATAWAVSVMEEDRLSDVRVEPVLATHWERGAPARLTVLEPAEAAGELPVLALGGSVGTPPDGVSGPLVVVQGLEEAQALGEAGAGRVVLFNRPMEAGLVDTFAAYGGAVDQRGRGADAAARSGAVAALVRSMTTRLDDHPHTGGMRYAGDVTRIPTAAVSTLGAERLAALVARGQDVVVRLEQGCRTLPEPVTVHNVVGDYRGRELPDEVVLVGGHLDAWDVGQGAHDDGGGCCQAIEAVRLLSSLGLRPRRTIRVVLFANEENGLAGGRGYVAAHLDEMPRHLLALESDSGVFTPRGFGTNAQGEALAVMEAIGALLEPAGAGRIRHVESGGADIGPLREHGVIQVGYDPDPQRYFDLHHSERDTLAQVSDREINLGAGVIAALLYIVADLPEPLPKG